MLAGDLVLGSSLFQNAISKIPTVTPSLFIKIMESRDPIFRLQNKEINKKTATTGRQPVEARDQSSFSATSGYTLCLESEFLYPQTKCKFVLKTVYHTLTIPSNIKNLSTINILLGT